MSESSKKKYNARNYMLLPKRWSYQLIDGDLVMTPAPETFRQIASINLLKEISSFIKLLLISLLKVFPDQQKVRSEII